MSNLTIRMEPGEKEILLAWAGANGKTATAYIKQLVAADMAAGSPQERSDAWFSESAKALLIEAERIKAKGVPGSHLALHHPWPDAEI